MLYNAYITFTVSIMACLSQGKSFIHPYSEHVIHDASEQDQVYQWLEQLQMYQHLKRCVCFSVEYL